MNKILFYTIIILAIIGSYFIYKQQTNKMDNKEGKLVVEVLKEGSGEPAKTNDKLTVNYTGKLEDGTKFDSSFDRGQPFIFTLGVGQVIKGWDKGLIGAKVGEKLKLTIPPSLAYGESGAGSIIPPNSTLTFEIEVVNIQ